MGDYKRINYDGTDIHAKIEMTAEEFINIYRSECRVNHCEQCDFYKDFQCKVHCKRYSTQEIIRTAYQLKEKRENEQ